MTDLIAYGPSPEQFGELAVPDPPQGRPLVMLIHGGFWRDRYRLDLMHPLVAELHRRGYPTWNIEYRRVGPTSGGYPMTLDDIARAIDRFADLGWNRTAVVGHSAGGHLALWNASRVDASLKPDLTVALAPVADVIAANRNGVGVDATTNFFGGDYADVPVNYEGGQPRPSDFAGRVVAIHGDADTNVPVEQSTALRGLIDRVEVLEGVDHFDVINPVHRSWEIVFDELAALGATDLPSL